jgi:hypothetical protein
LNHNNGTGEQRREGSCPRAGHQVRARLATESKVEN